MMEFEFTLKFTLTTDSPGVDELVECLGAAGCEDALVGIGQSGRIALDFTREADSAKEAIFSALADVKRAIPVAKLLEVTPDFVGLTDVAELVGVSRQNMRKLALTHKESFPAAVHEGSATLWHLSPVLKWLGEFANYSIKQSLLDVAHIAMQINLAKEASQIEHEDHRELLELVA
jgi:hypothetical protein